MSTVDYDLVVRLTTKLAQLDPKRVRFSIDASHINRLGLELVQRKETAVAELIKNAYDADATRVEIAFSRANAVGGTMVVEDNGTGMTRAELVGGFMRLSTPSKVARPRSPGNRLRAGNKGIGRFAAQRLGARLTVDTKSARERGLRVSINWDEFEAGLELAELSATIEETDRVSSGTTLRIDALRDIWDDDEEITGLVNQLAPLVQPFPISLASRGGNAAHGAGARSSDFGILVRRNPSSEPDSVRDVYKSYLDVALAVITGYVDPRGRQLYSVRSDRLGLKGQPRPLESTGLSQTLSGVRFVAYYYVRKSSYLPAAIATGLKNTLDEQGGIRVYRNGFRVPPYGDRGNDWLGLDAEYRKRKKQLLDPLGNFNFLGFVELNDPDGKAFRETSSREGLVESDAFKAVRGFVFNAIYAAVLEVAAARRRVERPKPGPSAAEVRTRIDRLADTIGEMRAARNAAEREELITIAARDIKSLNREFRKLDEERIGEMSLLRVLSSLGISLAEFIHEVRQVIGMILVDLRRLRKRSDSGPDGLLERLQSNSRLLESYTDLYDNVIRQNEDRELRPLDLSQVLQDFDSTARPLLEEQGVTLDIVLDANETLITRSMHPSEWSSILLNLMSNSVKAVRRARSDGVIRIILWRDGSDAVIDFLDNGDGIPKRNWDRVFDPFFTTTRDIDRTKVDAPIGLGLGLKIVRDIVTSHGGAVAVVPAAQHFTTCFRVSIPLASRSELTRLVG